MPDTEERPHILLITRNLPPLTGGMERLIQNMAAGISEYAQLTIIGPDGCSKHCPNDAQVFETSEKLAPFLLFSTWYALNLSRKTEFYRVIGGSGLIAPTLLLLRIFFRRETAVFLHGLDLVVDNFIYQKLFLPCIRRVDHIIANSRNTLEIAVEKGVQKQSITVINPGTTLPELSTLESREHFLERQRIPYNKVIIFVGRMTTRKGLSRFIEQCLPIILKAEPESGLVVVGDNPDQSLNNLGEQREILEAVDRLNLGGAIKFLGQVSDADLLACYASADVQILPLIDVPGDVEGFGMVAIEAAACGTPTVAFSVGGVADAVCPDNGRLIEKGKYDLFANAVIENLSQRKPDRVQCINHAKKYAWSHFHYKIKILLSS